MEYEDKQLDVDIPDTLAAIGRATVTDNVAEASFKGIELELYAIINQNFSVDLNVGYLDASYDDFLLILREVERLLILHIWNL